MRRLPAIFISHGAPDLAIRDNEHTRALQKFGAELGHPRAAVVVSAHWIANDGSGQGVRVGESSSPALLRDFGGFDPILRSLEWDIDAVLDYRAAPGAGLAAPTHEHFDPVLFTLGAMRNDDQVEEITSGFMYGTLSMRSFALRS